MVFKDPEETIQTYIDAGGLDHLGFKGFDLNPAGLDFGGDIAIAKQHGCDPTPAARSSCVSYWPVASLVYGPLHSKPPRY